MKNSVLFCLIALGLAHFLGFSQNSALTISEPYGPYSIGFKTFNTYDRSRSFSFDVNRPDISPEQTISRPVQVCVWYPATANGKGPMTYGEYFFLKAREMGSTEVSEAKKKQVLADFIETDPVDPDVLDSELNAQMGAVQDAPFDRTKKFPVLVYGPSWWSTAFENALLCEFLASHGYIVVSSPSVGPETREMPISRIGVETQARDMEFLLGTLDGLPSADMDHLAVAGFSLGGLSNVLMMARNTSVDAWIGIDPSIHEAYDFFRESPYEDYSRFSRPALFINSLGYMEDLPFYDQLVYSDAYMVNLPKLGHTDLASMFIKLFRSKDEQGNLAVRIKGYNLMSRYILAFLDGVFRDKLTYSEMVQKHFDSTAVDTSFVEIKSKKGLPRVDALLDRYKSSKGKGLIAFLDSIVSKDVARVYPETDLQKLIFLSAQNDLAKTSGELMLWYGDHYPGTFHKRVLKQISFSEMHHMFLEIYGRNGSCHFSYEELNHTGHLMSMGKEGDESIQYFALNTKLYPKNYKAFFNLGIGYFRLNKFENAKINFEKCLGLNPDARYKNMANDLLSKNE